MSMRERVELLDGTLTIDSAPGAGTTLTARLPAVRRAAAERRLRRSTTDRPNRSAASSSGT